MHYEYLYFCEKNKSMHLKPVNVVENISPQAFKQNYFLPQKPLVIKALAHAWPAYTKWNWDFLKTVAGNKKIGIYNNTKSDAYTPVNKADKYTTFGEYIDMISQGPAEWRIFLFNIFAHAPQLRKDFTWPDHLIKGFLKLLPVLFVGGKGSITHMHFDIDLPNIMHTQFLGRKRVLLFPYGEQHKLYRKPFEVLSLADFSNYNTEHSKVDMRQFPALQFASGYEVVLEHGDTLFMPSGYFHHMEYLDNGFAMTLRALNAKLTGKIKGAWNLVGMRNIDNVMKKTAPIWWYNYKKQKIDKSVKRVLDKSTVTN